MAETAMDLRDLIAVPGETASRLADLVKEHEQLRRKFSALLDLLREKQVLDQDELARFKAKEYV
jgi:hypothetical protein